MKLLLLCLFTFASTVSASFEVDEVPGTDILEADECWGEHETGQYDWASKPNVYSATECHELCQQVDTTHLVGFSLNPNTLDIKRCFCHYTLGMNPVSPTRGCGAYFEECSKAGVHELALNDYRNDDFICYKYMAQHSKDTDNPPHVKALMLQAAEFACAGLKDEIQRNGCIYDMLATQDKDMVGTY